MSDWQPIDTAPRDGTVILGGATRFAVLGIRIRWSDGKWLSTIQVDRKTRYIGLFPTLEEAAAARKLAESQFGFHPNHGMHS